MCVELYHLLMRILLTFYIPFSSFVLLFYLRLQTLTVLSGESGHPFLVPDFSAYTLRISPLSIALTTGLSYITFILLRYVLFLVFSRLLSWQLLGFCQKPFLSASIEMTMWFLSLRPFRWYVKFINLHVLNSPGSLEWGLLDHRELSFSCVVEFSLQVFTENFASVFIREIGLQVASACYAFIGIRVVLASLKKKKVL